MGTYFFGWVYFYQKIHKVDIMHYSFIVHHFLLLF